MTIEIVYSMIMILVLVVGYKIGYERGRNVELRREHEMLSRRVRDEA